jgi:quercetin dioxygenase-like cupin family protein
MLKRFIGAAALLTAAFMAGALWAENRPRPPLESHIWSAADARTSKGEWGEIHIYTEDATPTAGTESILTASLTFLPGKQLQPPHQHVDEEFQYVIEGEGTWSLNGREQPLKAGDLMYTRPGDWHGIRNSGDQPLRFFVFKFRPRVTPGGSR